MEEPFEKQSIFEVTLLDTFCLRFQLKQNTRSDGLMNEN